MAQVNKDKVSAAGYAAAASTEVYNIYEVGTILKISPAQVRYRVRAGTLPQPLHTSKDQRQWTNAMLVAAGITAVVP